MESFATNKDILFEKAENYAKTSLNLIKLNAVEKLADVISSLSHRIVFFSIVVLFTLFINIGVSLFIGKLLGEYYLGFLIVSSFYLILGIIIYYNRTSLIKTPVSNMIIKKLLKEIDLDAILPSNIH